MSEQSVKKGTMAKDTLVYMLAKGIEAVVGVLTMSVWSYLFIPEQMGKYSNINIAITTIAMVGIQWLIQSVLRYINKYDLENEHEKFYTTVFAAWLKVNLFVVFAFSFALLLVSTVLRPIQFIHDFLSVYTPEIIILGIIMFVTYNTSQLIIAMLAATRKTKTNLFLSAFSVTGKLVLLLILSLSFQKRIEWIFVSYIVFDGITSVVGILKLKIFRYINFKNSSPEILMTLKNYGIPLMGNLVTTSVLNKSDIYIITGYLGEASAGIYQMSYSIVATAFTLLSASVMRGSYPTIVRTWSEGKKEMSEQLVSEAVRFFMLVAIPAVIGVAAVSDVVAGALFEEKYFAGHSVMGWVALGMMFLGLTEYSIKPWELNAKTKSIFYRSLIGCIVNVSINIVFVPIFGYMAAAVSTCIGFIVYFILAKYGTRNYMRWHLKGIVYFRIIASALLMGLSIIVLKQFFPKNVIMLVILVAVGMAVYAVSLYFSGEIKNEMKVILNKVFKR